MSRKQLETEYTNAVEMMNSATTIEAFDSASAVVAGLRDQVIAIEKTQPTRTESRRQANRYYLRSIGMDVA